MVSRETPHSGPETAAGDVNPVTQLIDHLRHKQRRDAPRCLAPMVTFERNRTDGWFRGQCRCCGWERVGPPAVEEDIRSQAAVHDLDWQAVP